jgi:hypothetical protein
MMSTFDIHVRPSANGETAVAGMTEGVAIRAGETVFTRLLRPGLEESDDYLIAPPAQLAFWLVDNWWRVRWESIPPAGISAEWRLAHELSSIGGGYVWPRLAIWGEGERVGMTSRMDPVGVVTPVRFLTEALLFIDGLKFESAVDRFLDEAAEHWARPSDREALRAQVAALRVERADDEFAAWRRLEARLGFDPDEAPESLMKELADLADEYGESGVEEAAQAAPGLTAATTLTREIEVTREAHNECDLSVASEYVIRSAIDPSQPPWIMAERASTLVREGVGTVRGPLKNKRLADILGTSVDALHTSKSAKHQNLQYGLRLRTGKPGSDIVSLRSRWSHDRRFEMSRALGDVIWATNDELGPIARSKTARQKFQRAFAQSLLCPFDDLLEYMNTETPSDGDLTAAATHFHVSEQVVRTVLVNKKLARREILTRSTGGDGALEELNQSVRGGGSLEEQIEAA